MKYQFTIPLTPRIKKNSRPIFKNKKTGKHFLGKSTGLQEYEENCTIILQAQKNSKGIREPLQGKLRAFFQFEFGGCCRADFDNLIGTASDVLQRSGIIANDKQIKKGGWYVKEHTGGQDQTLIEIEILEGGGKVSTGS